MGFGIPGGAEAIVHSVRHFLLENEDSILVKLDYTNAFNSISRSEMILTVKEKYPHMLPFILQCYGTKSFLCYGNEIILSEEGVQQGDPLGPLLFCLLIQPIVESIQSDMNEWYLDDGSIGGPIANVIQDIKRIISRSEEVGLHLNPSKCEALRIKPIDNIERKMLNDAIPGILIPSSNEFSLLGAPLTIDGIPNAIEKKTQSIILH